MNQAGGNFLRERYKVMVVVTVICPYLRCLKCVNGECNFCKWDHIAVSVHKSCGGRGRTSFSQGSGAAFASWNQLETVGAGSPSPRSLACHSNRVGATTALCVMGRSTCHLPCGNTRRSWWGRQRGKHKLRWTQRPRRKKLPPWISCSSQWKTWGSDDTDTSPFCLEKADIELGQVQEGWG